MSTVMALSRPDYLVPALGVAIAFGAMWQADRRQHHHLAWTVAFTLTVLISAAQPPGQIPARLSTGFMAWVVTLGCLISIFLLWGAAYYAGWSRRTMLLLQSSCLILPLALVAGSTPLTLAVALDAVLMVALLGSAAALWTRPGLGRAAGLLLALRGLDLVVLTELLPGYTLQTRAAINQLLGCAAALLLLVAGFGDILRQLQERRAALEQETRQRTLELQARREELAVRLAGLERFAGATTRAVSLPLERMRTLCVQLAAGVDATGRAHLARAEAALARMLALLGSLHTLSRIATHALRREALDVSVMAAEAWQHIVERRGGEPAPRIDIEPGLRAEADRELLAIVLDNLLGNAWKYSARNPEAQVRLGRDPAGGFVVADNGVGFDPAQAQRLFEPFQRLHDAREFEGTGVGLATVRRIVERHGGSIEAWAQPGQGARFRFTLVAA